MSRAVGGRSRAVRLATASRLRGRFGVLVLALAISPCSASPAAAVGGRGSYREVVVHPPAAFDRSPALASLADAPTPPIGGFACGTAGCGSSPAARVGVLPRVGAPQAESGGADAARLAAAAAAVEQTSPGPRPPAALVESFDGQGFGMVGPHGAAGGRNPSDNSLAVGRDHVVEIVNSRLAVYSKRGVRFAASGQVLFGPVETNVLFAGFGGPCETRPNGDAVVRYDQLADRWLYVMPLFRRAPAGPDGEPGPFGICYALSVGPNPLGSYHRYYFERELFPDYPRPAVWIDGYYVPTSTGDDVIEKHACVVDRERMLDGQPATEQCTVLPGVNFLNNADIDGQALPPPGAPNLIVATGGAQLREDFDDRALYVWKFHVDWDDPRRTEITGPDAIQVAPYHYLCNGQLTSCVPQPDTDTRLDAQGDKIMQRLVYRRIGDRESIVAVHSVDTTAGAGGVRWYELRLDERRDPVLFQQGTYAPDGFYRWMASPAMDRQGNIGIGYSFGGSSVYPGQRFAGRLDGDPLGRLTFRETVLVHGGASQTDTLRWEDYTQTSMDPADDCTFWYVGDYLKPGAPSYTTRIGAFRLPGCLRGRVSGTAFFDVDHDGTRDANEPGLPGWPLRITGARRPGDAGMPVSESLIADADGRFQTWLPADPAYQEPTYRLSAARPTDAAWESVRKGIAYTQTDSVPMSDGAYTIRIHDREEVARVDFGSVCTLASAGGTTAAWWAADAGRALLAEVDEPVPQESERERRRRGFFGPGAPGGWRRLINVTAQLVSPDGTRFQVPADGPFEDAFAALSSWLRGPAGANASYALSVRLAATALAVAYGDLRSADTVRDPLEGDWISIAGLLGRVSRFLDEHPEGDGDGSAEVARAYTALLADLNGDRAVVTPADPAGCPPPRPR